MTRFVKGLYAWLGVRTPFDPQSRFVTSYLLPPVWLFVWRTLIALYALVTIILVYALSGGAAEFSYLTVLSYWGIWGYFTISAVHTLSFSLSYRRWQKATQADTSGKHAEAGSSDNGAATIPKPQSWLARSFPRPLQFFHYLLWSTVCTYPLLVTIVFWAVLSSDAFVSTERTWQNLSVHAFNLMFTMLDIIVFSRGPMMAWSHCFFCVLMLACYVGVAYITYAAQGFYPYDFLNQGEHGTGTVAGYVIAIGVASVVSFMIGQFVIFMREWIAAKIQRSGQWGSAKAMGVSDEAMIVTDRGPGPEGEGGRRHAASDGQQTEGYRQRWPTVGA